MARPKKIAAPVTPPPSAPMGRRPLALDEVSIDYLANRACTNEEIAAALGVSADTIENRFSGAIKKGKLKGFMSVKRALYDKAVGGDLGAIVFFHKCYMGYREKVETVTRDARDEDTQKLLEEFKALKGV